MECNLLNIKAATKQVWLYFSRKITRCSDTRAGTTGNLLNTQKGPYLNQTTQNNTWQIFLLRNENFKPKKSPSNIPTTRIPEFQPPSPPRGHYVGQNRNVEAALGEMSALERMAKIFYTTGPGCSKLG